MTQARNYTNHCNGKTSYKTSGLAREAANRVLTKGRKKYNAAVYFCPACGGFHWGNDVKTGFKPRIEPPKVSIRDFLCEDDPHV